MTSTPSLRDRTAGRRQRTRPHHRCPDRNESDNIVPLVARLYVALGDTPFEVIFVDDSDDSTPTEVRRVAACIRHGRPTCCTASRRAARAGSAAP